MIIFLIGLLLVAGPVLWLLNRLSVRYVFSWFWTILVCGFLWVGLFIQQGLNQTMDPQVFPLLAWDHGILSLALLLDENSWPFALALAGLGLGIVLTSAQRLADAETVPDDVVETAGAQYEDWRNQAATLILMWFGLVGVLAGNPLTLLLAWAGADLFGAWVLLIRIVGRLESERIVLDFSARVAGILLLLWAMVVAQSTGEPLGFEQIPPESGLYLLLACGFRLGILPLQIYFFEDLPLRRGIGLMVRIITPVVSSLVLLVRLASSDIALTSLQELLLILIALAGLYTSFYWFVAKNEIEGRSYWVLGTASLAIASALKGEPMASQAWGLALLLVGGGLFLFSARSKVLRGLMLIGALMMSALPWTPTAQGVRLYAGEFSWSYPIFVLVHIFLVVGFIRHAFREGKSGQVAVRAIRAAYTLGLLIPLGTFFLAGGLGEFGNLLEAWWVALVGVVGIGLIGLWIWRGGRVPSGDVTFARNFFSFHWLYRLFWRAYRLIGGGVAFLNVLLEGEAGMLWTLLLLFMLISLFTSQAGLGG